MKMNNEIIISHISMPYGVLHDQKLNSVKCENNQMIFTFDIKYFRRIMSAIVTNSTNVISIVI